MESLKGLVTDLKTNLHDVAAEEDQLQAKVQALEGQVADALACQVCEQPNRVNLCILYVHYMPYYIYIIIALFFLIICLKYL
jgi:hypothetical protein